MREAFPAYATYGEPARPVDLDFIHVDRVMNHKDYHGGKATPHLHPHFGQLSLWFKGGGRYEIEGKAWTFEAPMMHFVPANTLHGFEVDPATTDCWAISIANHALAGMADQLPFDLTRSHYVLSHQGDEHSWKMAEQLFELAYAEYSVERQGRMRLVGLLTRSLFEIFGRLQAAGNTIAAPRLVRLALDFQVLVDQHYAEDWKIEDYCRKLGVTRHQLARACQELWQQGIKDVIDATRLRVAQRMLHYTVSSVEAIAYETGFNDPAYFSRFFRKMTGQSPAAWRQQASRASQQGV